MNEPASQQELQQLYVQGKISRRQFLRSALVMGLSLGTVQSLLAACAPAGSVPGAATTPAADAAPAGVKILHAGAGFQVRN